MVGDHACISVKDCLADCLGHEVSFPSFSTTEVNSESTVKSLLDSRHGIKLYQDAKANLLNSKHLFFIFWYPTMVRQFRTKLFNKSKKTKCTHTHVYIHSKSRLCRQCILYIPCCHWTKRL
jgi:hypothetical protein